MNKEKFDKLKALATQILTFGIVKPDQEPQKFEAFKIKDGETMVEFNPTLELGSPVMVSSGTGSSPAPNGAYEFDSGIKFKTEDGKISEVESDGKVEETDEEKAKRLEKEEADKKENVSKSDFNELVETVNKLAEGFAAMQSALTSAQETFSKIPSQEVLDAYKAQLKEIGESFEAFNELPVESPADQKEDLALKQEQIFNKIANAFIGEQK